MTIHEQSRIDLLMFAIDPAMHGVAPKFILSKNDEDSTHRGAIRVVANAGQALRAIYQHEPQGLLVWVSREHLDAAAQLIESLRRRRPQLPLLAITPEHDPDVERAVRSAGAGYYFALDGDGDPPMLRQTLKALGLSGARASPGARPPSRAGLPRIRGRPQAVFRSP